MNFKLSDLKTADLFKPESFLVYYSIFLILTAVSFFLPIPLKKPSIFSFIVIFATFPFFYFGFAAAQRLNTKKVPFWFICAFLLLLILFYAGVTTGFYHTNIYLTFIVAAAALLIPFFMLRKYSHSFVVPPKVSAMMQLAGLVLLAYSFFEIGGIPLLERTLRHAALYSTPFGIAMLSFILGFVFLMPTIRDKKTYALITIVSVAIFSLMALRGTMLTIFFTGIFIAYYMKKLDNKKIAAPLFAALLIIIIFGYIALPILSPEKLFFHRLGTTHIVFDNIVEQSSPFGLTQGTLFFQGNPRDFVGAEIMNKPGSNLTYGMLGAPFLEFGIIGAFLWMFFLGFVLKLAYLNKESPWFAGFYPLLFSLSLIWMEMGIDQFFLIFLFVFLLLYFVKYSKKTMLSGTSIPMQK